jgi:hypothetical protein
MAQWIAEDAAPSAAPMAAPNPTAWQAEEPTSWLTTADDTVRAVANSATFGMADRFAGAMEGLTSGQGYRAGVDAEVAKTAAARERSPVATTVGDITGALAIPGFGAARLAARYGGGLLARAGAYGGTGAVAGAAQGAGNTYSENPSDYLANAGIGAAISAPLGAAGGAAFARGPRVSRAVVPDQNELFAAKNAGYDALGNSGARYEGPALARRADDIERQLFADRYHPRDSPGTWRSIEEGRGASAPGGPPNLGYGAIVDPGNIDFIVKGLNRIPQTAERATDRDSARIAKRAFNDFIENPPPGAVLPGTERAAAQASTLARSARGNNAAYRRVQAMDELVDNATNTTGATASGLNLQNELRKGVRTFVKSKAGESPASKQGFTRDEIARLTQFTRPGMLDSTMRWSDRLLGGGGGLGALVAGGTIGASGIGGSVFKDDPVGGMMAGGAAVGTGLALRMIGNRRANANINEIRDMIARRSPLYEYRQTFAGTDPGRGSPAAAKATRDAIAAIVAARQNGERE